MDYPVLRKDGWPVINTQVIAKYMFVVPLFPNAIIEWQGLTN